MDDHDWLELGRRALRGLTGSAVMVGMLDDDGDTPARVEFMVQIGHCILADKPIIITAPHGAKLSKKLAAVADRVVHYNPNDPGSLEHGMKMALHDLGLVQH
jgi:hypothetical protein